MKAATTSAFSVDQKYARIAGLILAYVWHVDEPREAVTFALPYAEAVQVAEAMGWTKTASWQQGRYTTTSPSTRLRDLLEPFRMSPGRWWDLVVGHEAPDSAGAAPGPPAPR
jgi:hypothetical protein